MCMYHISIPTIHKEAIMNTCECPGCHIMLDIEGCGEMDIVKCPKCGMRLEIVSIWPPIVEEALDDVDPEWDA